MFDAPLSLTGGYATQVILESADKTLVAFGFGAPVASGSDEATLPLHLPAGRYLPRVNVIDIGNLIHATRKAGSLNGFVLPEATAAATVTLALPKVHKLSGDISDPGNQLWDQPGPSCCLDSGEIQAVDLGVFGPSGVTPDPPWIYAELGDGRFYKPTPSYKLWQRAGTERYVFPIFYIPVGPGGVVVGRENGFATLYAPALEKAEKVTFSADLRRSYTVPQNVGPNIALTGTVKDMRGMALPGYMVSVHSTSLVNLSDATHEAQVTSDTAGGFLLHILPGTFRVTVSHRPNTTAPAASGPAPDAGVVPDTTPGGGGDAAGDCGALVRCCDMLAAPYQAGCTAVVATGSEGNCRAALQGYRNAMLCQ
jgi:hypothetical protein